MQDTDPRVLYWGTSGVFSRAPLLALIEAAIPMVGIVIPRGMPGGARRATNELPVLSPDGTLTIRELAKERDLPVFEIGDLSDPDLLAALAATNPDLICVACFPRLLPPPVLALPRWGCLNVHPSLLPRHRGPAPLFWTFRHGDPETGVTIHIMVDTVDSGDLLLQKRIAIPEGISGPELEQVCATEGGALLVEAARGFSKGSLVPHPQDPTDASYESWPTTRDLEVPTTWSARRAYGFIRGVSDWYPVTIAAEGRRFCVGRVLKMCETIDTAHAGLPPGQTYRVSEEEARIRFTTGVLHVTLR